jgi:pimeloyl-ACP methyl ester carboxylesterase
VFWVTSACPVGLRVAVELLAAAPVRVSAPRHRRDQVRAEVAARLGGDPGGRLELCAEGAEVGGQGMIGSSRLAQVWHLTYGDGADDGDPAALARRLGIAYRRFELDPVATGPDTLVSDPFAGLMQAVHRTVEEVRARDPDYFEQHALRTTRPDVPFLTVSSAASAVLAASAAPPGACRITAPAGAARPRIGDVIGDTYGVELILDADPSSLSAIDRLLDSRLGGATRGPAGAGQGADASVSARTAEVAGAAELADVVSAWRRHQSALQTSERKRLADFPPASTLRAASRGGGPEFRLFGDTGPLMVIVNAVAQSLVYWTRLIDRLAVDHRIAIWPLRSVAEGGRVTVQDDHVLDLEVIVEDVAEGPVHLVGWCTGPKACAQYYLAHPERVASMVFLAGTYRPFGDRAFDTPYERTLEQIFDFLGRSPSATSAVRATLVDALGVGRSRSHRQADLAVDVLARVHPSLGPSVISTYASDESTHAYARQLRDFWDRSFESYAGAIRVPVLVIGAELDRIASPKLGERVANALPMGRFLELPGATHYCMYDRPDEVAAIIRRFVHPQGS